MIWNNVNWLRGKLPTLKSNWKTSLLFILKKKKKNAVSLSVLRYKFEMSVFLNQIFEFILFIQRISTDFASYQKCFTIFTCARPFSVHSSFFILRRGATSSQIKTLGSLQVAWWLFSSISASACQPGEIVSTFT